MDNFAHSLAGWALGQTGFKNKSRKGLAALILGANLPDIDVFFGGSCWLPLATHRGFTHSLVGGIVLMPPMLAALLWLLDRWQVSRGATFKSGLEMHFGWLYLLCLAGSLTHPLLDLQTSYSVQLLSPFSNDWFHEDSLFIIDVWLWTVAALAIWLSRRQEKRGGNWRKPAIVGLLICTAYIAANWLYTEWGKADIVDRLGERPDVIYAQIEPVTFWKRRFVWRQDGMIGAVRYSPFTGWEKPVPEQADNMNDPIVRRAMRATPEIRKFMRWSTMPIARVERERCRATVDFSDARYSGMDIPGRSGRNPFQFQIVIPLNAPGCEQGT